MSSGDDVRRGLDPVVVGAVALDVLLVAALGWLLWIVVAGFGGWDAVVVVALVAGVLWRVLALARRLRQPLRVSGDLGSG